MTAHQSTTKKIASPQIYERLDALRREASAVILDKGREIELALCCFISGGHLLIEDIPGVGKTTLVKTLSKLLAIETSRIQFTNDLLPADMAGFAGKMINNCRHDQCADAEYTEQLPTIRP